MIIIIKSCFFNYQKNIQFNPKNRQFGHKKLAAYYCCCIFALY